GVVFMCVVAVNRRLRERGWYSDQRPQPDLLSWTDLVALGTVCDVVPLVGLNRAFVVKGLMAMARRANTGLAALADVARLGGPIKPYHLGFVLGPRINAGGRIGDASLGATLLSTNDPVTARQLAETLQRLNGERQEMETQMLEQAMAEADREIGEANGPAVLVTAQERWHPGIVGLVAARLKDRFQRPAVAIAMQANGIGTGSARSIPGFDIGRAVRAAIEAGIAEKGGGHPMAAGLTVRQARLGELRGFLLARFAETAQLPDRHELAIDGALTARGATLELLEDLDHAGPYGAKHPEPLLVFPNHRLSYVEERANGHIRVRLSASDGAELSGIAFRAAGTKLGAALVGGRGEAFHVAGHLSVDRWRDRVAANLRVRDAAPVDQQY
ncbi:MAG: single-stranded-DNA-specific exonuclease RecJ, partial [Alphaproteobacteria bacterium]